MAVSSSRSAGPGSMPELLGQAWIAAAGRRPARRPAARCGTAPASAGAWTCSSSGWSAATCSSSGTSCRVLPGRQPRLGQRPPDLARGAVPAARPALQARPARPRRPAAARATAPAPRAGPWPREPGRPTARPARSSRSASQHVGTVVAEVQQVAGRPGHDRGLLPSTVRRYETWLCSVFSAAGAVSPQTTSTRRPVLTTWPACSARVARTALRRRPLTGRTSPPSMTSTGPSSRTRMTLPVLMRTQCPRVGHVLRWAAVQVVSAFLQLRLRW